MKYIYEYMNYDKDSKKVRIYNYSVMEDVDFKNIYGNNVKYEGINGNECLIKYYCKHIAKNYHRILWFDYLYWKQYECSEKLLHSINFMGL